MKKEILIPLDKKLSLNNLKVIHKRLKTPIIIKCGEAFLKLGEIENGSRL